MALTTATAFDEFKNKLLLTETQRSTVRTRRDATTGYLRDSFPSSSDLPVATTRLIGSAARDTIIRPLDDVDLLAEFTNKEGVFGKYRYDSQAFLYRIRQALSGYSVQIVGARGQAVRLFYKTPPHVDIAPMFKWSGSGFALPNGQGGWLTTDPDFHANYIARRDGELDGRLKPLVRMLKRWNHEHSRYFKSFHLEVMAASVFKSLGNDSRDNCEKFFEWGQKHVSVQDPAGHSSDLAAYMTQVRRQNALANMETARQRASTANAAERRSDHREAIRLWRVVFGDEFPAYG